jgi:hypothetical protein
VLSASSEQKPRGHCFNGKQGSISARLADIPFRLKVGVPEARRRKYRPTISVESSVMTQHRSDQVVNDIAARYFLVLGAAAADLWGELPQDWQHRLFERAVLLGHQGEQDESLREQLAKFMHDHHERTLNERATHERALAH